MSIYLDPEVRDQISRESEVAHQRVTEDTDRLEEVFGEMYLSGDFDWIIQYAIAHISGDKKKKAEFLKNLDSIIDAKFGQMVNEYDFEADYCP